MKGCDEKTQPLHPQKNPNQTKNKLKIPKQSSQREPKGIAVTNLHSIYMFKSLSLATQDDIFDNKIGECVYFFSV